MEVVNFDGFAREKNISPPLAHVTAAGIRVEEVAGGNGNEFGFDNYPSNWGSRVWFLTIWGQISSDSLPQKTGFPVFLQLLSFANNSSNWENKHP